MYYDVREFSKLTNLTDSQIRYLVSKKILKPHRLLAQNHYRFTDEDVLKAINMTKKDATLPVTPVPKIDDKTANKEETTKKNVKEVKPGITYGDFVKKGVDKKYQAKIQTLTDENNIQTQQTTIQQTPVHEQQPIQKPEPPVLSSQVQTQVQTQQPIQKPEPPVLTNLTEEHITHVQQPLQKPQEDNIVEQKIQQIQQQMEQQTADKEEGKEEEEDIEINYIPVQPARQERMEQELEEQTIEFRQANQPQPIQIAAPKQTTMPKHIQQSQTVVQQSATVSDQEKIEKYSEELQQYYQNKMNSYFDELRNEYRQQMNSVIQGNTVKVGVGSAEISSTVLQPPIPTSHSPPIKDEPKDRDVVNVSNVVANNNVDNSLDEYEDDEYEYEYEEEPKSLLDTIKEFLEIEDKPKKKRPVLQKVEEEPEKDDIDENETVIQQTKQVRPQIKKPKRREEQREDQDDEEGDGFLWF